MEGLRICDCDHGIFCCVLAKNERSSSLPLLAWFFVVAVVVVNKYMYEIAV